MDAPPAIAVLGFSASASPLEPAWPSTHRALLPVAGKPLVIHLLELLARGGIREVRIAGPGVPQRALRQRLGDGTEWGVTLRYCDLSSRDLIAETLLTDGRCVSVYGDQLYAGQLSAIRTGGVEACPAGGDAPGFWRLDPGGPRRFDLAQVTGGALRCLPIDTVAAFHQANLETVRAPGGTLPGCAVSADVIVGWDSKIASDVVLGPCVSIGRHCRLHAGVRLDADCVLGNGVIVGRHSQFRNVTVLPNTYIGAQCRLRDAVVTPQGIFRLDGAFLPSPDRGVIGRTRRNHQHRTGTPDSAPGIPEQGWAPFPGAGQIATHTRNLE